MSNNVMSESFFSNKQVPMCEKTGFIALLLGGTLDKNAMTYDGRSKCFSSFVFDRRGMRTPVMFTYGRPESLSEMACKTQLHNMGVDRVMSIDKIFDGSFEDSEIIEKMEDFYRGNPNIDKSKFTENFDSLRLPNIEHYSEQLKNTDVYIADNPRILEVAEIAKKICGSKKKELMN